MPELKLVRPRRPKPKKPPVDVHVPYVCDHCGSEFKTEDDRGRCGERKSWDVTMTSDGGLDFRRRRKLSCLRCETNGNADKFTRKCIASLMPLYAGTGRRAKKRGA